MSTAPGKTPELVTYENLLNADRGWAVAEGSRFFENEGAVQRALRRVTTRLAELGIPYAVVGALALYQHGYRRFTEDVDVLVTRQGLELIHVALRGRGYRPASTHPQAKNLRDTEQGVKIEFLITGQFPGDGQPKPVAFPDPDDCCVVLDGIRYLRLETLIELKLASGMSAVQRGKDLVDVGELITVLRLPLAFGQQLHESVRPEFERIWHTRVKRYVMAWRIDHLTAEDASGRELQDRLAAASSLLRDMLAAGIELDPTRSVGDDCVELFTTDPNLADRYGLVAEEELLRDDPPTAR